MPRPAIRAVPVLAALALVAALGLASEALAPVVTRRVVETGKALLAAAGAALLIVDWIAGSTGRGARLRADLLAVIAVLAACAWWNFFQLHYHHFTHYSDAFHYYVGSKYFDELGYTRLYACVAVADFEAGPETGVAARDTRDLTTNRIVPAESLLSDPEACRSHFSDERWRAFTHDVGWFRSRVAPARWRAIQRDHGYNAPPSWTWVGGWLANRAPASDTQLRWLTALDPALLAVMWACVAWAFGARALCVAVIYWGTNLFGDFGWTGGGILRQSWLFAAVVGVCCLRRGHAALAGFLMTGSAGLRVFPGALLAGWALGAVGRRGPGARRFLTGCAVAGAAVAAVGAIDGFDAWPAFARNSSVHLATPLKNHVGLRTLLAYDADSVDRHVQAGTAASRYERWAAARTQAYAGRAWIYWILLPAMIALVAFAARGQPGWIAAVLGVGLIPIAFELTNYYWSVLLLYGLLAPRWPAIGVGLCAVSALGWLAVEIWPWQDEYLTWSSALVGLFAFGATALVAIDPTGGGAEADREALP